MLLSQQNVFNESVVSLVNDSDDNVDCPPNSKHEDIVLKVEDERYIIDHGITRTDSAIDNLKNNPKEIKKLTTLWIKKVLQRNSKLLRNFEQDQSSSILLIIKSLEDHKKILVEKKQKM